MSERRQSSPFVRTAILAVLGIAVAVVCAQLFFRAAREREPERPVEAPVVVAPPLVAADAGVIAAPEVHARVNSVSGRVEKQSGEGWVPLGSGDELVQTDRLRTLHGGQAEIEIGGNESRLTVTESSDVTVLELSAAIHNFKVKEGRVRVDYQPSKGRVLRLESANGAVAQTKAARFTVLSTGTAVAVVTDSGDVALSAKGQTVKVGAGEQSVVLDESAPTAPKAVPKDVLLKVARAKATSGVCVRLNGKVRAGTELVADGERVWIEPDGRYSLTVKKKPGLKTVKLVATEPSGLKLVKELRCENTRADQVDFRWGD